MEVPPDNTDEYVRLKRFPPGFFEIMVDWTTTHLRRRAGRWPDRKGGRVRTGFLGRSAKVTRSVPPRGSGWVLTMDFNPEVRPGA